MKRIKCICTRIKEGYINLKCKVHNGTFKINLPIDMDTIPTKTTDVVYLSKNFYKKVRTTPNLTQ